jgi:hypothetical protein
VRQRRISRKSQIGVCLLVAFITPLPMVSLEFHRRIVDDARCKSKAVARSARNMQLAV